MWNFKDMHLTEPPETCFKRPPGNSTERYHTFMKGKLLSLAAIQREGLSAEGP